MPVVGEIWYYGTTKEEICYVGQYSDCMIESTTPSVTTKIDKTTLVVVLRYIEQSNSGVNWIEPLEYFLATSKRESS
jgi:hypothetical protein